MILTFWHHLQVSGWPPFLQGSTTRDGGQGQSWHGRWKFKANPDLQKLFLMLIPTSGHHLQVSGWPPSSKDPPPEIKDRGSLDEEDNHFRQSLLYKICFLQWYWHLDTISRCQDDPSSSKDSPPEMKDRGTLGGKMTVSDKACLAKVVPNYDTNWWKPSVGVRMTPSPPRIHH